MNFKICALCLMFLCAACNDDTASVLIYNENNTSVVNGVVYDMQDKPINGVYKIYYQNGGVRMEVESKDGLPDGEGKFYDEEGTLQNKTTFRKGQVDGPLYNYYPDGQVHNELNFTAGVQNGAQKTYDENGELIAEVVFANDKPISGYTVNNGEKITLTPEELKILEN
ncbi:MAG: hypothetical protein MJ212_03955 [Alphaproteobacteria bacterium]|nr:hypothetical protein [Alphaproteobacteria bacterium]